MSKRKSEESKELKNVNRLSGNKYAYLREIHTNHQYKKQKLSLGEQSQGI